MLKQHSERGNKSCLPCPIYSSEQRRARRGGKERRMRTLRWFQTKVGLFQDPRMIYLLSQPNGDSYFVIWFYLKDLAGMVNDNGYIYVSKGQAVTTALLARQLRRRSAFIEKVLDVFEQIDLISRDETGLIRIVPWHEIQSFDRDEKRRRDARDRMRRYRRRKADGEGLYCDAAEAPVEAGQSGKAAVYDGPCSDEPIALAAVQAHAGREGCPDEAAAAGTAPVCPDGSLVAVRNEMGRTGSSYADGECGTRWDDAAPPEADGQDEARLAEQGCCALTAAPGGDSGIAPVWPMPTRQGCDGAAHASYPSAGHTALRRYTEAFGQMSSRTAEELTDLVRCWGDEAVCAAIDIARDNGAPGIRYIRAVLVNSGGRPRRRETMYERREKEFNQYIDTMLRQIWESGGDGC